jgi:rSAM/selenodomain-associated transferase 1
VRGGRIAVIVFARAPLPGRAKSRLGARLGDWGAARLQARLTLRALRTALAARCGPVELHGTPRPGNAFLGHCARRFAVTLRGQRGADLGERMHRALARSLRSHRAAILIGADSPELRARDLARAARLLRGGCDAVLAPAEDGGYALIGLRRVSERLFGGMPWGGPEVYARATRALASLGWRWRALRTVWDVDRPQDLERLRASRLLERR